MTTPMHEVSLQGAPESRSTRFLRSMWFPVVLFCAIAVVLYNPRVASVSSDSSAPLFGDIARTAVGNLGIPASTSSANLYPTTP